MLELERLLLERGATTKWLVDGRHSALVREAVEHSVELTRPAGHGALGPVGAASSLGELFARKGWRGRGLTNSVEEVRRCLDTATTVVNDLLLPVAVAALQEGVPCVNVVQDSHRSSREAHASTSFSAVVDTWTWLVSAPFHRLTPGCAGWLGRPAASSELLLGWSYPPEHHSIWRRQRVDERRTDCGRRDGERYAAYSVDHWSRTLNHEAVIRHPAGLETCLAAVALGAWSVVTPTTWEQRANADRLIQLGAGELVGANVTVRSFKRPGKSAKTVASQLASGIPEETITGILDATVRGHTK